MSLSAYNIGRHVWIVRTEEVAEKAVPAALPIGSVVLDAEEASKLGAQVLAAALMAEDRAQARGT